MRNLNECQAEVFRRSEKRIKARKQRRMHILAACIPLALCIAASSALMLQETREDPADGLTLGSTEAHAPVVDQVEITGQGVSLRCTEIAKVQEIAQKLDIYTAFEPEGSKAEGQSEVGTIYNGTDGYTVNMTGGERKYTITVTLARWGTAEYCLTGNTLENRSNGHTVTLTAMQLLEIKSLLGIS